MSAKLFQWFLGSVKFTAEGGFPERFINLMEENGIPAQYLIPNTIGFVGAVRPEYYQKLRPIARKSGMRIRISEKSGLPFLFYRYHHRTGLLIGLTLLCAMLFVMQLFVWNIKIEGCSNLDETLVMEQLRTVGVYPGAYIPQIDSFRCERDMMQRVPELSWIAVNVRGSTIEVQLRERIMPPAKVDREDAAANVISGGTGIIREMEVYSGQPLVQVGEAVWDGRMLVTGIFVSNQHTLIRYARAKIIAEVEETIVTEIPLEQEIQVSTGITVQRFLLQFGEKNIVLNPWTVIPEQAHLRAETKSLPFGLSIIRETYENWESQRLQYNRESAKQEALRQLKEKECILFPDGYLTKTLTGELKNGAFVLTAQYTCLRDVAQTQEILMDE